MAACLAHCSASEPNERIPVGLFFFYYFKNISAVGLEESLIDPAVLKRKYLTIVCGYPENSRSV